MIVLFTDFGAADPYVGQVKAQLAVHAPGVTVIDLLHEVPAYNPHAGAHLLAALAAAFPSGTVFLAVVDPGVGTSRGAVVVEAEGRWYAGPDNGLLSVVAARAESFRVWRIDWRAERLSATFHGRDLFAPIAAAIAVGAAPIDKLVEVAALDVVFDAGDLARVIYIDHYGNAWTGLRGIDAAARLVAKGVELARADTYGSVERDQPFWYVNSVGLVEMAVNRGSAAAALGLAVGERVGVLRPS